MSKRDERPEIPEVITELAAGLAQMHEFMTAAVDAGFTPEQAFRMVLELMRSAQQGGAS